MPPRYVMPPRLRHDYQDPLRFAALGNYAASCLKLNKSHYHNEVITVSVCTQNTRLRAPGISVPDVIN